jgi:hypothetical protein
VHLRDARCPVYRRRADSDLRGRDHGAGHLRHHAFESRRGKPPQPAPLPVRDRRIFGDHPARPDVFYIRRRQPDFKTAGCDDETVGKTLSIGAGMYTEYLLPVEIVGILLLMAIIGGVILVRRLSQPQLELVVDQELERRGEGEEKDDYRIAL